MSDRVKEKDRVRSSSDNGERFGLSTEEKGKKTQSNGLQDNEVIGPAGLNNLKFSAGPSNISNPSIEEISIQSKPLDLPASFSAKPNVSSSLQQPLAAPNITISLRPQTPSHKLGHDKHLLGTDSILQSTTELDDSFGGADYSTQRRHNRFDTKGPSTCVGMVRRRNSSGMGRDSCGSPSQRLSRSPSPNRHDLVTRNQSFLELPHGHTANRRDPLSIESSLSAIAGAAVSSISGGGVLCNTSRIRREEGPALNSSTTQLGRKSKDAQASAAKKVHTTVQHVDQVLRTEGIGISQVPVRNGSNPEQSVGDVAREGMEFTGSGRHPVSDSQPSIYVIQ